MHTVIYGAYVRLWPTLHICVCVCVWPPCVQAAMLCCLLQSWPRLKQVTLFDLQGSLASPQGVGVGVEKHGIFVLVYVATVG